MKADCLPPPACLLASSRPSPTDSSSRPPRARPHPPRLRLFPAGQNFRDSPAAVLETHTRHQWRAQKGPLCHTVRVLDHERIVADPPLHSTARLSILEAAASGAVQR